MLSLIWSEVAITNLEPITEYISDHHYRAALELESRVRACAERLPAHPYIHRPGRVAVTREAVVHPNYLLIYRVREDIVEIVDVLHTSRRYPPEAPPD